MNSFLLTGHTSETSFIEIFVSSC